MARISANGILLEYDEFGERGRPPLLMVMGLGAQMTRWDERFLTGLADAGHHVIRFDNRDVGLSQKFDEAGTPEIGAIMAAAAAGREPAVPYTLDDMAADALGLLDALDLDAAHVCGVSMGGMIAQTMALNARVRVRSLTSIMSSTGDPSLPPAQPDAMAALMSPPGRNREEAIARAVEVGRVIGSPGFPQDAEVAAARAARDYDRSAYPDGVARQMAAVVASGNRRPRLEALSVPALVVHGEADPLVPVAAGIDTHQALQGSVLLVIEGMGHDLPEPVWPRIIDAIAGLTRRVEAP